MDQWNRYFDALDGKELMDWTPNQTPSDVPSGFYKRSCSMPNKGFPWEAFAIWRDDANNLRCERSGPWKPPTDAIGIEELYGSANRRMAITKDVYDGVMAGGPWPEEATAEQVETTDAEGEALTPIQIASNELEAVRTAALQWHSQLGETGVATQEQADKAANYAEAFSKISKKLELQRKLEKQPHKEAGEAVDASYNPLIEKADKAKKFMKDANLNFLQAEQARRDKEHAEKLEKARLAEEFGGTVLEVKEPEKVRVGSGRRQSIRKIDVVEIIDIKALSAWIAASNNRSEEFDEVCRRIATKANDAGVTVPGIRIIQKDQVV